MVIVNVYDLADYYGVELECDPDGDSVIVRSDQPKYRVESVLDECGETYGEDG